MSTIHTRADKAGRRLTRLRQGLGVGVLAAVITAAAAAAPASAAQPDTKLAAAGTPDIVAVHHGSWGYKETVFSRDFTKKVADTPVWDLGFLFQTAGLMAPKGSQGALALAAVPLTTTLATVKIRANQAKDEGSCFAVVQPTWAPISFAAKTFQDCR